MSSHKSGFLINQIYLTAQLFLLDIWSVRPSETGNHIIFLFLVICVSFAPTILRFGRFKSLWIYLHYIYLIVDIIILFLISYNYYVLDFNVNHHLFLFVNTTS